MSGVDMLCRRTKLCSVSEGGCGLLLPLLMSQQVVQEDKALQCVGKRLWSGGDTSTWPWILHRRGRCTMLRQGRSCWTVGVTSEVKLLISYLFISWDYIVTSYLKCLPSDLKCGHPYIIYLERTGIPQFELIIKHKLYYQE